MVSESKSFSDDANGLSAPELFSQAELNDVIRDLRLSKKAVEVIASRLQEKHLLDDSAKVSYFRKQLQKSVFCDIFLRTETICLLSRYPWSAQAVRCCLVHSN